MLGWAVDLPRDLLIAERAARVAGEIVATHYARGSVAVELKLDDSPVTQADREADAAIYEILHTELPGDSILSEERPDDGTRLAASRVWIVDPLDGTRDFIARSGEFAVHVGLAVDGRAAAAAVYQPIGDRLYAAAAGGGATVTSAGQTRSLRVSQQRDPGAARIGVTRMAP